MIDEVCKKLMQKNITVSVAESFTGGNVASEFVKHSGISQVFQASVIAYSNEAKIKLLGVKKDTIDTFDAVSKECAIEMAQGARRLMNSDISISTTGFAGPSGGNDCNPVGTCYFAIATESGVDVRKYIFSGTRQEITEQGVNAAFEFLHCFLKDI